MTEEGRPAPGTVWTMRECAAHCGMGGPEAFRKCRGRPEPLPELNEDGLLVFDACEVFDWDANRPGLGWRRGRGAPSVYLTDAQSGLAARLFPAGGEAGAMFQPPNKLAIQNLAAARATAARAFGVAPPSELAVARSLTRRLLEWEPPAVDTRTGSR